MKNIAEYKGKHRVCYTDNGHERGYPILIQHGMIASVSDHHLFVRLMEAGARVVSIARPGYGESSPYPMKDIAEWGDIVSVVVDNLQLSQFDVLGISSGAPYSYSIGHRLPKKVRHIFILSGTPALFDDKIAAFWPYPLARGASIDELQKLARELFFADIAAADLSRNDIRDSMMNNCFGIALDLKLRCIDWGFNLADVTEHVLMQHSRTDAQVPLIMAEMTSKLLPHCRLDISEKAEHFSVEVLNAFIEAAMLQYYAAT